MKFNIGDRVRVKPYENIPIDIRNRGLGKSAGREGEIVDIMYSKANNSTLYKLHFDGEFYCSRTDFPEGTFDLVSDIEQPTYTYEFEFLDNVVIAKLYEVTEDSKIEIARGHGHTIHEGVVGIAQAASYALKKIFFKLTEEE